MGCCEQHTNNNTQQKSHIFISFDVTYWLPLSLSATAYMCIRRMESERMKYDIDRFISFYFYIVVVGVVGECMYIKFHVKKLNTYRSDWQKAPELCVNFSIFMEILRFVCHVKCKKIKIEFNVFICGWNSFPL